MLDILFETSWEVCNRVGGIYAVLSTKAHTLQALYNDKTIFIGPDLWSESNPSPFFIETSTPLDEWKAVAELPAGMTVRTGRWDVPGKPLVVLVNYNSLYVYKNELYGTMWRLYSVDSLHAYGDYDESCVFSYGAGLVIESIMKTIGKGKRAVAHFDEWTTGMGLLYVKSRLPQVATVFTTHATSIGRSICGNGKPLYDYMSAYNGDQMSRELNMESKHSLEKAAAHEADAFTTVSEVTARECEQLLERRPIVTPNAFESDFVPKGAKYTVARRKARKALIDVARALTGDESINDKALLVGTSGRAEFRNKGLDLFLDSLNVLRSRAFDKHDRQVVAFILVPGWVKEPRTDLRRALDMDRALGLFNPVITHQINNPDNDAIYRRIGEIGFGNKPGDKVKVIYVPCYLNGDDGILNMKYYDLLPGLDLTVFASYYEPWGYTPLESAAFAVPTITSDLAGFGQWIITGFGDDYMNCGVKVVHRNDSNYNYALREITDSLATVAAMPPAVLRDLGKRARKVAQEAMWQNFISCYKDAYSQALQKKANK